MTNYEEIKKTSEQTPNEFLMFGKAYDTPKLSILPSEINEALVQTVDTKKLNKPYFIDDGKHTLKVLGKFVDNDLVFEYFIKYNNVVNKKVGAKPAANSYDDYVQNYKFYMISAGLALLSLLIFSLPLIKAFT